MSHPSRLAVLQTQEKAGGLAAWWNGLYIESTGDTPSAAPTEDDVLISVSHLTHSRRTELERVDAAVRLFFFFLMVRVD